jgi:ATP/maltotriose-dependent transcriptional regulator MalT
MLDESDARIILLVAPAGYGKTTLAHEWLEGKRAAWYRGSHSSADVAALAVGLAYATAEVIIGAGERMRQRLRATDRPEEDARILAEMLAEDLSEWPSDAWLVIDDYQFAMDSPACEELVEVLLEKAHFPVLITSRRRPSWATARRRLYGRVFEIDRTFLAMNDDEASELLSSRADAAALIGHAAGWPAVIGLAALTGSGQRPRIDVPTALYDYFAEELLNAVAGPRRVALCRLAVMPSITERSANFLLGANLAGPTLSDAVEAGLLQRTAGEVYELHPLLRAFLQERLSQLGDNVVSTVADVGRFLLAHREWDDALALAEQFRVPVFLTAFIESAWESLLDEGRLATVARLIDLSSELRIRSPLLDLVESELAFRQGGYRKAETLAVEATRGLSDNHLLVRAHVRAGQSAHLEGREKRALEHHRRAQEVARSSPDQREAVWGEFVCSLELESEEGAALLNRIESLGVENATDSIRLANGRMLWAIRSGSGIEPDLFSAVHSLSRVDDPLIRSSFLHVWSSILVYTARYADALEAAHQQINEIKQNRLEFALPHALINEALALRGLRRFREALRSLRRAERDRPGNDRIILTARAARIGVYLGQGDVSHATQVPGPGNPGSAAPNVIAELTAHRALALACAGQTTAAIHAADRARSVSTASESHVVSGFAMAIAALGSGRANPDGHRYVDEALLETRDTGYADALVTSYRGYPQLLKEAASRKGNGLDVLDIALRANDRHLATKMIPDFEVRTAAQQETLSERETEVLRLVAQGLRNREIGQRLFISEVTVKAHMRNIMRKLGARSRTHAVSLAELTD